MLSRMIAEGLKKTMPNVSVNVAGRDVEIIIPYQDIVNDVRNRLDPSIRHLINVTFDQRGLIIKVRI